MQSRDADLAGLYLIEGAIPRLGIARTTCNDGIEGVEHKSRLQKCRLHEFHKGLKHFGSGSDDTAGGLECPLEQHHLDRFLIEIYPRNTQVLGFERLLEIPQPIGDPFLFVDGTSRVQTVGKDSRSGIRQLLEKWYVMTGCPMLLNTSLNIRGEPIVNTVDDARRFEQTYGIRVLC